ncbi:Predicted HD-superfamily hydrolase [Delftia tsuruhatensis]|uniref:MobH family relaxase n=1 Tax=Delftia tsuruhatensis TaxID=180282 RepID=UPI001E74FF53|nr:MobH family relaxase [Delftia tsuruhatensis]CAB5671352.1 Predicted HD-superfamily hydrolase [Delftia tsuruhatensis]CAC9683201.1 Predicted HD-superfamily hydrolase [Delftia tsuruhatensis]
MFKLFFAKKSAIPALPPEPADLDHGLIPAETAATLLATPQRKRLLEHIWQRTSLSRQQFAGLYGAPLERYAELVQQFPASESHHHAYHGGMLDHGLEIVAYALKLRQSHLFPVGATAEDQAEQAEAWTAAAAYAALLHDIGKLAVDLHVEGADGHLWHPWHGPLRQPYRFRYREDREYRLHGAATGLLYTQLLDRQILDWLCRYPALWASLLYVLAGQYEHAGLLGELVVQADRASVAQALGGDPTRALAAPKQALQRKLIDGLRHLLKTELKLNQAGPSDGWLTQDALWLVSKTVADKLRAHLLGQGSDGIPSSNTTLFNVLQDHGMVQPTPDGKAIWRCTIVSDAGWSHGFTLLKLSPALIWAADERPEAFNGVVTVDTASDPVAEAPMAQPSPLGAPVEERAAWPLVTGEPGSPPKPDRAPDALVDDLLAMFERAPDRLAQAPSEPCLTPAPRPPVAEAQAAEGGEPHAEPFVDEHFVQWLALALQTRRLILNDAKALLHTVADTLFLVSPGLFQRYAQEHPHLAMQAKQEQLADWQWVQKRFEKLRLHRKQPNGLNIWTCEVTGPRKSRRVHGYLLDESKALGIELPAHNNPYLSLKA